jgi:hypothetical protein
MAEGKYSAKGFASTEFNLFARTATEIIVVAYPLYVLLVIHMILHTKVSSGSRRIRTLTVSIRHKSSMMSPTHHGEHLRKSPKGTGGTTSKWM